MFQVERDTYKLNPFQYNKYLKDLNNKYLGITRVMLSPLSSLLESNDVCAIVVGSDGKSERHPQSVTEVVFIQSRHNPTIFDPKVITTNFFKCYRYDYGSFFDTKNDGLPNIYRIGSSILSYVSDNPSLVYPDRILNSRLVLGNLDVYNDARITVAREMGSAGDLSCKIRKELNKQRKRHLKVCSTGVSRNVTNFDENYQYYDERINPGMYGFKHGFIRLVQRILDLKTQSCLREGVVKPEDILEIPTSTIERLRYFPMNKDTPEAYLWFLQQYHLIQNMYKERRSLVKLEYDNYVFRQCSEIITRN